jgi:hypothetical protein
MRVRAATHVNQDAEPSKKEFRRLCSDEAVGSDALVRAAVGDLA